MLPPLHRDAPLLCEHQLAVGEGHVLHVDEHGHPQGVPALVLHGGPGSGCSPVLRRFFNPERFRIISVDQRGAGRSQPPGHTPHNTTAHLLADLRRVRSHLGLGRWWVVGGSWGATLALLHAIDAPQAVAGLLLRSSFLARAEDIDWFFQGARSVAPKAWEALASIAPADQRHALLPWLAQALRQADGPLPQSATLAWWRWEQALAGETHSPEPNAALATRLLQRYRVQSHYLLNQCFLAPTPLLSRCAQVPKVPTLLLHGRLDRVCRPEGAQALQQALPHAQLQWVDAAGHDATHPDMAAAMVQALGRCVA